MKTKSFTLIELLVVIVIIGILSGVIVISVTNYINDAKNSKIVAELSNLSKAFEGYSNYYVGSLCIEDSTSNSAFKSYYGLTSVPVHPNYDNGTSLTTNNCYLYFSDGDNYSIRTPSVNNQGYLIQESRHPQTKPIQKTCDTGWIPFGNRCVMQYEARAESDADGTIDADGLSVVLTSNSPTSTGDGLPWRTITQIDAKAECASIGAHLITNAEWMAIARDIESVASNYVDVSGTSTLKRGNVGDDNSADYNGGNPETGILNDKAKLRLSNGQEIYHFSGNVWEWSDDKIQCNTTVCPNTLMPYDTTPGSEWIDYTNVSTWGKYSKAELSPLSHFTGTLGVGRLYTDHDVASGSPDIYTHAFLRGGDWGDTSNAGVFALYLSDSPSNSGSDIGFRCAR